jgi:hypothetical protein
MTKRKIIHKKTQQNLIWLKPVTHIKGKYFLIESAGKLMFSTTWDKLQGINRAITGVISAYDSKKDVSLYYIELETLLNTYNSYYFSVINQEGQTKFNHVLSRNNTIRSLVYNYTEVRTGGKYSLKTPEQILISLVKKKKPVRTEKNYTTFG